MVVRCLNSVCYQCQRRGSSCEKLKLLNDFEHKGLLQMAMGVCLVRHVMYV